MPNVESIFLFDPLRYFSVWVYVGVAIAYTALAFHGEFSKQDGPLIFSRTNSRTKTSIAIIHLAFLAVLFALMRCCIFVYPSLPNWMVNTFALRGSDVSILDILYILAMIALHQAERRFLYVESNTCQDDIHDPNVPQ